MEFLFVAVEGGGVLALGWRRGGGVEICVTNYLARLTSSLRAKFEVEKMSEFFACCQDSANLKQKLVNPREVFSVEEFFYVFSLKKSKFFVD